jgi:hypothetical protein
VLPTPPALRCLTLDHGTGFISRVLENWSFCLSTISRDVGPETRQPAG